MVGLQKHLTAGLVAVIAVLWWLYAGAQEKLVQARVDLETEKETVLLVQESLWDTEDAWKKSNAFAVKQKREKEAAQRELQILLQNDPAVAAWGGLDLPDAIQRMYGAQGCEADSPGGVDAAGRTPNPARQH